MTRRKRTEPPPLSDTDTPKGGVRQRTTEPGDDGRQQATHPDVEMAAPTTEEPPTVQLESPSLSCSGLGASQVELADPSAPSSELVKDTLSYEETEELDRQIRFEITPWTKDRKEEDRADTRPLIVKKVVRQYSVLDRKYVEDFNEVGKLLNNNRWLLPILDKCWEKGEFCVVRRLKILRPATRPPSVSQAQEIWLSGPATLKSWEGKFKGDAAEVLLKTISSYLAQVGPYGPYASVLNSSGTGKSRMVDELSTKIIMVPICLREGVTGFPPPDVNLRRWLHSVRDYSRNNVMDQLLCFLSSLLNVTLGRLQSIAEQDDIKGLTELIDREPKASEETVRKRQKLLAETFRELMTNGQTFEEVNEYRRSFFDEVVAWTQEAVNDGRHSNNLSNPPILDMRMKEVLGAGRALQIFVDSHGVLCQKEGMRRPFVIFSLDEAHGLTKFKANENWSIYSVLCSCLGPLGAFSFFFLFISTAGKFSYLSPDTLWVPSSRISGHNHVQLPSITETGFDQLAFTANEGQTTLEEVMMDRWITHLGRPLFGSRYDAGGEGSYIRSTIVAFATSKLLAGPDPIHMHKPLDKALACFSVRFPFEFNFAHRDTRAVVGHQVEHHMRLCTVATSGFEVLFSTVGSEPLLAEASMYAMHTSQTRPIKLLSTYMDVNCISVGERGEVVAALLVMRARDVLATSTGQRWVWVIDFMEKLVAYPRLRIALPKFARPDEAGLQFQEAFNGSRIWMNHVLQVRNTDLINVKYLWRFVTRGAMILCADGQRGVDLVIPVVHSGGELSRDNMTAILIQVKNDKSFTKVHEHLFDGMDPFRTGVFDESTAQPRPIIRMVFALASDTCEVKYTKSKIRSDDFTAYDFWCGGLDTETFPLIDDEDRLPYQHLLARTRDHGKPYDVGSKSVVHPNETGPEHQSHFHCQ
ncbi:hypothetical protein BC826DRAFT_619486 [Russula brevipes]|nr:hypothetical protein BC826DRAFT_619486 [Russula brevipes]